MATTTYPADSTYPSNKKALRRQLREMRAKATPEQRRKWSARIGQRVLTLPAITAANTVFCYVSMSEEVDTREIIKRLAESEKQIWLPRIVAGRIQALPFKGWDALAPGQLGILEPRRSGPEGAYFDVTLSPGLGFSTVGDRIGYGAGHYDRWFRNHSGGLRVGLTFSSQLLGSLPVTANDVPMNVVITEDEVIETS